MSQHLQLWTPHQMLVSIIVCRDDTLPQYGDGVRSLPKPSPIPIATSNVQKNESQEEDNGEEEDEESVDHLSAEDLLKGHVKRAKRVRARLREVRLKRIARYKSRLALLLPPLVEQFRNDAAAGT
ncbi:Protein LIN [Trema orientale]|uniref:Protein LIN n=1 Tax=Trema orientale TaxID=63057 RepID=A0A2P5EAP8_TREOI|nr:Protein LIN [Trema orientale]